MQEQIPADIAAAVAAYLSGEKTNALRARLKIGYTRFYQWLERLEIPRRGRYKEYRKAEPDPHVKAAVAAYAAGEMEVADIIKKFGLSHRCVLYEWAARLGVPKRRWIRHTGKAGRPADKPFVHECAWCEKPLSPHQIARRRKYCCRKCQDEAIAKSRIFSYCPAPGCGAAIYDDTPYCSWTCFKSDMEKRFA